MNSFIENLTREANTTNTANGAVAYKSTLNSVYDLFAFGGAYRNRSEIDCINLFKNAYEQNPDLALKTLFYIGDCRGGQGERRFFRVCFKWLATEHPHIAKKNMELIPEYRRWDDLIYSCLDTPVENDMLNIIKHQLALDIYCETPSLLAKWLPSENASSAITIATGNKIRTFFGMTHKQYRKTLSVLREKINILEKLMSTGRWDEIEFDKIPSKAGLVYRNAFARRDILAKRYESFIKDKGTKVNAGTLYPYEIVQKAICCNNYDITNIDRFAINKYWDNQIDYLNGANCNIMCVCDTSSSMHGTPINMAIGLSMYCAERLNGPFKNKYISFSSRPQLININGVDFVDKVHRIYSTNLCENTNIEATFKLLKNAALKSSPNDIPKTLVIISDMQIDAMSGGYDWKTREYSDRWTENTATTEMERIRKDWERSGLKCPKLVYWNVNASRDTILDMGPDVSFVSGSSPVIFKQILTGKTGWDLCLETILSDRYKAISFN